MGGLFLSIWIMGTIAPGLLIFILFPLFGILGGAAFGRLNSKWAKRRESRKNEMTSYAAMMFFAIVFLGLYYFLFGAGVVENKNVSDMEDAVVVILGMASGVMVHFGFALVVATASAEQSSG